MNILVRSQEWVESGAMPDQCYVLVSVSTPGQRAAALPLDEFRVDTLFLEFHDVDKPFEFSRPGEPEKRTIYPITEEQAARVWAFVEKYRGAVSTLVCQCEAGVSRSAGIAAAVAKALHGDDAPAPYFRDYVPKESVYRAVCRAAGLGEVEFPRRRTLSDAARSVKFT